MSPERKEGKGQQPLQPLRMRVCWRHLCTPPAVKTPANVVGTGAATTVQQENKAGKASAVVVGGGASAKGVAPTSGGCTPDVPFRCLTGFVGAPAQPPATSETWLGEVRGGPAGHGGTCPASVTRGSRT